MTQTVERIAFQAETRELLDLVIHSLYTNKEIFLRELISNASDALDKLRFEALTRPELQVDEAKLGIHLAVDPAARVLCVIDNGIGMSREELIENVGTIARSGTKSFLSRLREAAGEGAPGPAGAPALIGQFGVGFYSAFMAAEEVVLETRRAGEERGTRWTSRGEGDYTVEEIEKPEQGTTVMLHLKPPAEGERDFTAEGVLRDVVKRYSDFIAYPIEMEVGSGDERTTAVLNSRRPLWTRPRAEISDEDYHEFYRHLSHDWREPLEVVHFKAEGASEYTALLYVPRHRPLDLFDPGQRKSRIDLYVKRVFITADCEELVPPWLRFVRGVVDSADLPLNISRETLQHNRQMAQIRKRVVRKVLDALRGVLTQRRADYATFWRAFGPVLEEGIYYDDEHREELAALALFPSSAGAAGETDEGDGGGPELTTLGEYVERMPVKQREIYVLVATDVATAQRSPHLEVFRAKGYEVLFLTEPVDEFVLQRLTEFGGKKLRRIDQGVVDVEEAQEKEQREEREKDLQPLLESVRKHLAERVESVRFSSRLKDSAACLVGGEHGLSPLMERYLRDTGQPVPPQRRVLELNAAHPLIARLEALSRSDADFQRFGDFCELLHGQALLAEGSPLPDPARFSRLVTELMLR